jgi:hypothetical protein
MGEADTGDERKDRPKDMGSGFRGIGTEMGARRRLRQT